MLMFDHHSLLFGIATLMLVGFFAAIVDTLAGGGGLIALPALMSFGLPPVVAIGTNKLQGLIGELVSLLRFRFHYKALDLASLKWGVLWTAVGSVGGTVTLLFVHPDILRRVVPFLLSGMLAFFLFCPRFGREDVKQRLSTSKFGVLCGCGIGFYNGFFGPGTGSFWVFALMLLLGYRQQRATVAMKPLNMTGNLVSLIFLCFARKIDYIVACTMIVGQVFGAYFASHLVAVRGYRVIRPLFIVIVGLMTVDLFMKGYILDT